ncbi:MAG TPA: hemolysin family protein, partial [Chlamydiales bacterium]|nr:hemolysin family protein [Chlamydiales bacterium]
MIIIFILILVFLISMSAVLSAAETSLFSISPFTVKSYKSSKVAREKDIYFLLSSPKDLLVTIMMLNIFANILIQNTVATIFNQYTSILIKVGIPLILTLFFGEVIPKSVAIPNNLKIAKAVAPLLRHVKKWTGGIRILVTRLTSVLSHAFFFFLKKENPILDEELDYIIEKSKEKGILSVDESLLIQGYMDLNQTVVKEHIRPRGKVWYYSIQDPLEKLFSFFLEKGFSRIPVCDETLDQLIGVIDAQTFFAHRKSIGSSAQLLPYLSKPSYIPETTKALSVLYELRQKNVDLGFVVDEYGVILGIVTQEDLIEVVIGEIEHVKVKKDSYTRVAKDAIIASGQMEIEEFNQIFTVDLSSVGNKITIAGWLEEKLEDIPQ